MNLTKNVTLLLVEDDDGHARLVEKNLRRAGLNNELLRFKNGKEIIDHLYNNKEKNTSDSYLILLDLNMPVMGGLQVLKKIKSEQKTKNIPVIILTTTEDPKEVEQCYQLGCNIYITKPVEYEQFTHAIKQLGLFLSVVTFPYHQ